MRKDRVGVRYRPRPVVAKSAERQVCIRDFVELETHDPDSTERVVLVDAVAEVSDELVGENDAVPTVLVDQDIGELFHQWVC